jgi:hypothetical protein
MKQQLPSFLDDPIDDVDGRGRRRAGGEQQITLGGSLAEDTLHRLVVITDVLVQPRLATRLRDRRGDGVGVDIVDLALGRRQRLARPNQLLARRDDTHRRSADDRNTLDPERRQQPDLTGTQPCPGPQRTLAGGDVGSRRHDTVTGSDARPNENLSVVSVGPLDHDDRVCPRRDDRSRRNLDALTGLERYRR